MKIIFSFILFIQLCAVINGTRSGKPNWSSDSSISKPRCRRNEVFSECGAPCPETCELLNVACRARCRPGGACICRDGYVRNERNKCVRATKYCRRSSKCGRNEVFSKCASFCEPQCNVVTKCRDGCEPKCICRDGFIRNSHRECIPDWKCPPPPRPTIHGSVEWNSGEWNSGKPHHSHESHEKECEDPKCFGHNQIYCKCGPAPECAPTCDHPEVNSTSCWATCHKGCYCDQGYVYNKFGDCVLKKDCPVSNKTCSGNNEVFSSCGKPVECTPTCDDRKIGMLCTLQCVKGCYCKDGYIRNRDGICIPEQNCPVNNNTCLGANENYLACGKPVECTPTCDDRKNGTVCIELCTKGCYCKDGYIRDSSGVCIPEQDCPAGNDTCTGINEVFEICGTDEECTPTCDDRKMGVPCTSLCVRGCYCEEGYLRNSTGVCIPDEDCPAGNDTCTGINEVFEICGTDEGCTPTCDDRKMGVACTSLCVRGCYCEEGYLRNSTGVCIPEEDCPAGNDTCTGINEVFEICGTDEGCTPTCDDRKLGVACTSLCVRGCYCEEGYLRNSTGVCIPEEDCPAGNDTCTGINEVFEICGTDEGCTPTCDDRKMGVACTSLCVRGCYCEEGYLRNSTGVCIPEEDCPAGNDTCTGINEVFEICGTDEGCTPTCDDRKMGVACTSLCVRGCYCEEGYLRNSTGVCIPEEDCPAGNDTCTGINEVFEICGTDEGCTPTCDDRKMGVACTSLCVRGCYCQDGYLRDSSGICIPEESCPVNNTCVGDHKVFSNCSAPAACLPTCENPQNNIICDLPCAPGCICEEGYLINAAGECIDVANCPMNATCDDPNKEFNSCGRPGCTPTCENPINNQLCSTVCVPGCYCRQGFLINAAGRCIASNMCPPDSRNNRV